MEHEHDIATLEDACRQKTRELREQEAMSIRLGEKLTATTNALKGKPAPLHRHSTHDVAEVAAAIVAERDVLRGALDRLGVAIADAGYTWTPAMREAYDSAPNDGAKRHE